MTRKQTVVVVLVVAVASPQSALVAYRRGLRQAGARASAAVASAQIEEANCADFRDAERLIGRAGCVSGRVLRVATSRAGHTFLDFCPDYRQCPFASVIFAEDRNRFGDLGTLWGKQVEIRGPVTTYKGRAEIIIRDPNQIRVLP